MKRKILVPMFASVMALSINTVSNADEVENKEQQNKEDKTTTAIELGEFEEYSYKVAAVKDGVAVKIREKGDVQKVAYSGSEFKILGLQGDWVNVEVAEGEEGWMPSRYVDIKNAKGYITKDGINFREESNTDSKIMEELEIGTKLEVIEVEDKWIKVKKGEKEGYVSSSFLSEKAPVIEVAEENSNSNSRNNQASSNKEESKENKPNSGQNQNPPASNSSKAQAVINLAYSKMGSPYIWGAEGPNAFDCSGFTSYVFRNAAGVNLPRTSSAQSGFGATVSKSNLKPGDLVFFNTSGSGVSHVGIYVGGGNMIHSPSSGKTVSVTSINSSYYSARFVTAKRVL